MQRLFALCFVWLVTLAGCGGQLRPVDDGERAAAETAPWPTLSFAADWSVAASAQPMSGGKAIVHYDLSRLPKCRTWYMGYPA